MKKRYSESTLKKTTVISRKIFMLALLFFFLAGVFSAIAESFDSSGLKSLVFLLGGAFCVLFVISLIMPMIYILLGVPWLSFSWLQGINPIGLPSVSWEQVSAAGVIVIYLRSIISFAVLVLSIVSIMYFNF